MKRFLTILSMLAAVLTVGSRAVSAGPTHPAPVTIHVVQPGETLWHLASGLPGDRRVAVDRLMHVNHLRSPGLQPGQRIAIPRA